MNFPCTQADCGSSALLVRRSGDAGESEQAGGTARGIGHTETHLVRLRAEAINSAQEYSFFGRPRAFAADGVTARKRWSLRV
ncbi:hypothetical protein [Streptomyces sp. NBC_01527]|uniref:hypothetical protein n=1 Tax=Streptomyces sp. NBC_01527 TaxID=2903894 RepID=UPI00386E8C1A